MKRFSNILFGTFLLLLVVSVLAPVVGLEITIQLMTVNALLFIASGIITGAYHKGERQTWVIWVAIFACLVMWVNTAASIFAFVILSTQIELFWLAIMGGFGFYSINSYS